MRQILNGPDYVPASTAELDLSMLKEGARTESGMAEMRDASQGMAAHALQKLQNEIDATVGNAYGGEDALQNLRLGRKTAAQRHDLYDSVKSTFGKKDPADVEPVGAVQRLTWGRDTGINALRDIAQRAPDRMPEIARAYLEGGGKWENLGPETQKILVQNPDVRDLVKQYSANQARFEGLTKLEPAKLFDKMTADRNATLSLLQDVARYTPERMPDMFRAFVQDIFDTVVRGGDVEKTKSALNAWDALGKEGKQVFLPNSPELVKEWDNLFTALNRVAAEPNPSGSGYMASFIKHKADIAKGITGTLGAAGGYAHGGLPEAGGLGIIGSFAGPIFDMAGNAGMARLLYDPKWVKLLTQGLRFQLSNEPAAAALVSSQLMRMAQPKNVLDDPRNQRIGTSNGIPVYGRPPIESFWRLAN